MSNSFSQHNRLLELTGPNNNNDLTLTHFEGYEGLSSDFCFHLSCLSSNTSISKADWMGNAISATLHSAEQGERIFNGVVSAFKPEGEDYHGERRYNLTIMPWFHTLTLTKNSRIYQHQTVPSIFQMVCKEFNFIDFDTSQLGNAYQPIEYVVQYNESYHHFLQRILAKAGIFYTYTHTNNKHTLVLLDSKSAVPSKSPHFLLTANHTKQHLSQWQAAASNTTDVHYQGQGNILNVVPNKLFELDDDQNNSLGIYYPNHVTHDAKDSTHRGGGDSNEAAQSYVNHFTAFPKEKAYQPTLLPKPDMLGPQSAVVVGPAGKPIYTDNYGRVKVQFHWDRLGKHNENSSCWLRVAQMQAGDTWGSQCIPRVGDEVIVDFINGNADNPVIIGSVHHQDNQPIFPADDSTKVISGLKSALVDGSGLAHELSFDDTPGNEKLTLASAGDYKTTVMNDMTHTISGDETLTLNQDVLTEILEGGYELNASSIEINVGGSQFLMDASAVHFNPAGNLYLLADGVPGTYPIARVGDQHQCPKMTGLIPHQSGPILKGSTTILDGALPVARTGDQIQCVAGSTKVTSLVKNIQANGKNIGHLNAKSDHSGKIIKSASKTFIGPKQGIAAVLKPLSVVKKIIPGHHIADILYDVTHDAYYAVTADDLDSFLKASTPLMQSLHELQKAIKEDVPPLKAGHGKAYIKALKLYQKTIDKRNAVITKAKSKLNKVLHPMVKGDKEDEIGVQEFMRYTGLDPKDENADGDKPWYESKRIYGGSADMKKNWFEHKLDKNIAIKPKAGESKLAAKARGFFEKYKDPSNHKISTQRLRKSIATAMGVDEQSVTLADYNWEHTSKNFNKTFHLNDFDGTAQAQLFRGVVHGGADADVNLKEGKVALSADGKAQFALAQGKVHAHTAIPSMAGYPISVNLPDKHNQMRPVDLGALRAYINLELYGFAGASVAGNANLNLSLKQQGEASVLQAQGNNMPSPEVKTNPETNEKADLAKNGLKASVNAFAGATAGVDTGTSLEWQNPDDIVKKVKAGASENSTSTQLAQETHKGNDGSTDITSWSKLGTLNAGGSGSIGIGASAEFKVSYDMPTGKFTIKCHAQIVCGFGVSGDFGIVVDAEHIEQFVAFVYHKLKNHNFNFIGFIENEAFKTLQDFLMRFLYEDISSLEIAMEKYLYDVAKWWYKLQLSLSQTDVLLDKAERFASNINQNPTKLQYTPPEVKGRMLALFTQKDLQTKIYQQATEVMAPQEPYQLPASSADEARLAQAQVEEIQTAMVHVLSYIQSDTDFQNVIQHMTLDGSRIDDSEENAKQQQLYNGLGFYGRFQAQHDPHVNGLVQELQNKSVFPKRTVPYTAVIVNKGVKPYAIEM